MADLDSIYQYVVLRHFYYEYHYSPHKLAFQNIMRAGDQKLMIKLEWPNNDDDTTDYFTPCACARGNNRGHVNNHLLLVVYSGSFAD